MAVGQSTLRALVAAAMLAAVAPALAAQAADGADGRLVAALDYPTQAAVTAILADARTRGLPAAPLVAKALEGVEKGASAPRIEHAVRAMLGRLDTAHAALAPSVGDAEVVAGADAIAAGVPPQALRRLRKVSPQRSTAVALGVLAQLVSRKVPVDRATDAVITLLRRGAQPSQLLALDGAVQADLARGVPPSMVIDVRMQQLLAGIPGAGAATPATVGAEAGGAPTGVGRGTPTGPASAPPPTVPATPTTPANAPPPGP